MRTLRGLRALGYLRCSTDEQSGASLPQQKDVILRWAVKEGLEVTGWISDEGVSGTLREDRRPGLRSLLEAIKTRTDFSVVVCFDVSRLGRFQDANLYSHYFVLAHDARKVFTFVADAARSDDSDIGKIILRVVTSLGAGEKSRVTAAGAIRGQVERARRGRCVGGFPPFGFDHQVVTREGRPVEVHRLVQMEDRRIGGSCKAHWTILDLEGRVLREVVGPPGKEKRNEVVLVPGAPERVQIVQRVFGWYAQGWGFKLIASQLNRQGASTLSGRPWACGSVRAMLRNPAYHGIAAFNRTTSAKVFRILPEPDDHGFDHTKIEVDDFERGRVRKNPKDCWFQVGGVDSPIAPEVAQAVEKRLDRVAQNKGGNGREGVGQNPRTLRSPALLAGFVICGRCGSHFRLRTPWSYACGRWCDGGEAACARCLIRRRRLEDPIIERIGENMRRSASAEDLRREFRELLGEVYRPGTAIARREALEAERDQHAQKAASLVAGVSAENLKFLDGELSRIRTRIQSIEQEIAALGPAGQAIDLDAEVERILRLAQSFREDFAKADPVERKRILAPFLHRVTVDPETRKAVAELYKVPLGDGLLAEGWYPHTGFPLPQPTRAVLMQQLTMAVG